MMYKHFPVVQNKHYSACIFRSSPTDTLSNFDFTLHWHRDFEIIYVDKGSLTISKLDSEIVLNDGDVYFINSEELHSYKITDNTAQCVCIAFLPQALQPYLSKTGYIPTFRPDLQPSAKFIAASMKQLMDCKNFEDRLETLRIKSILNNIYYYLIKDCVVDNITYFKGSDSDDFACAKSAILYMEQNYRKDIPLGEIASYVGMTPSHFSKYFKDKTDLTFSKYLRKIRLDHALNDMVLNNTSVKDAALNNGFPNVNSFITTCKDTYEKTPLEMKNFNLI